MKRKTTGRMVRVVAMTVLAGMFCGTAQAQTTYTWTQTAGGAQSWSTGANWSGGSAPSPVSGDTVDFSTVDIAADTTLTLGADRTATSWNFGDTMGVHNWSVNSGNKMILAGTTPTINVVQNTVTLNNVVDGTAGLVKTGTGTLTLSGANTHTGTTTIGAGTLKLQGANMWKTARTYTINGGAVLHLDGGFEFAMSPAATTTINGTGTLRLNGWYGKNNAGAIITLALGAGGLIDIQSGATLQNGGNTPFAWAGNSGGLNVDGTLNCADGNAVTVGALTGSGSITRTWGSGTHTLTVGTANGSGTFSGTIVNPSGTIALTKTGTGTQTLSGNNSYSGGTTISGGTLIMTSPCSLANGALNVGGKTFAYRPTTAGALNIGSGVLTLANGSTITTAIGGTASQSAITSSGAASLGGTGTVNIYSVPGVAHAAGGNNLITAGSGLTGGTYTLGKVYNNTDFTVSALTRVVAAISTTVSVATPITTAYWKGGLSGANNVWAASDGSAGCNWVTAAGGGASAVVPGSAADVIFSANTVTITPVGSTLGADMTIKTLAIADTANGLGLENDGYTLTIAPESAETGLAMNANVPSSYIAAKVNLGADQTWTLNSANALIVSGIISGAHALTKAGTGTLILSGANTYSGVTTVTAGNLTLASAGSQSSSGSVTVSGGTLAIGANSGGRTLANSMILNGGAVLAGQDNVGSGGTIIVDGNGVTHIFTSGGSLVLPMAVTANALIVGGGGGGGGGTSGAYYDAGGGGGQVRNLTSQALSAGTTAVTVGAGGAGANNANGTDGGASSLGGTSAASGKGAIKVSPVVGGTSGSGNPGGGVNAKAAGGGGGDSAVGGNAVSATAGGPGGGGTANSAITGLLSYGYGQASSGSAYFGGGGAGTAQTTGGAGGLGGGGASGAGVDGTSGTANTGGGGGGKNAAGGSGIVVVQYPYTFVAGTVTLSGGIDLQSASTLDAYGSGGLLDVTTSPITTSAGSGGLTIASSSTSGGVVRFGSSNTYNGDTTINSGAILRMNAVNAMPYGGGKGDVTAIGTFDLNGNSTQLNGLSGSGIVDGASGTPTLTVGNNDATSTFNGVIQNTGGTLALTKTGSGTLTLSGANTYTGATTINGGTLLVNGSIASAVTVSAGVLGGAGSITGNVTVAATGSVSPGSGGAGTLSIDGALDISALVGSASNLIFQLNQPDPAVTSDRIAVTGTLTIGSGVLGFSDFTFTDLGGVAPGTYTLITSGNISGSLGADIAGTVASQSATLHINGGNLELVIASSGTVFKFR